MTLRPETALILSSIDYTSIATFPEHLDPCIDEAVNQPNVLNCILQQPEVLTAPGLSLLSKEDLIRTVTDPESLRQIDANAREAVAKCIRAAATIEGESLTDATPVPGVRIPTVASGQPQIPIPFGIKLPELAMGTNTIEFQEIIPGIKPPSIPMIIPFFEKLPLLPGWTIRDKTGMVLNEGMKLPLVEVPREIFGIKIPDFLPRGALGYEAPGPYETAEPDNQYSFDNPDEEIHSGPEVDIYPERGELDAFSAISNMTGGTEEYDEFGELGDPYHRVGAGGDYGEYPEEMTLMPESDGSLEMDEEMELGIDDTAGLEEEFET